MHFPYPRSAFIKVLGLDDRLEHAKMLVGCLPLDRCLVEAAEGLHDALLALARNPRSGEDTVCG